MNEQLFDKIKFLLSVVNAEKGISNCLIANATVLREAVELCKQTGFYAQAEDRVKQQIAEIAGSGVIEDKLAYAWVAMLELVVKAPTQVHRNGVVTLQLPVVAHFLPSEH